jgi:hypothetical protein
VGERSSAEAVLAGALVDFREALAGIVNRIISELPPEDRLWDELVVLTDRLYGSGVVPLGRLTFISDRLLELLSEEAASARRPAERAGAAGRFLANLAVSRKLRDAVADAVGFPVAPTYRAVYQYDSPGSHVKPHVDAHGYDVVFHLILEHVAPANVEGSALVVRQVGEPTARRVLLRSGEAVALRGRGTIHSWEPIGPDEDRTLLAIGFQRADGP